MTRDFRPTLGTQAADIRKLVQNDPTAIQGLLFRADRSAKEALPGIPTDLVGSMEASEKIIDYDDPVTAYAVELPVDFDVGMETAGDHASDYAEEPRAMLIDVDPVPKGSVFVYDEFDATTTTGTSTVRRIFYVASSKPISKHPGAGVIHFMLPFLDYEGTFGA